MKKLAALLLAVLMCTGLLAGCGGDSNSAPGSGVSANSGSETYTPAGGQNAALSGAVSTNGSTSMEKVIGVLGERSWPITKA